METFTRNVLPTGTLIGAALTLLLWATGQPSYALFAGLIGAAFGCAWAISRDTRLGVLLTALGCFGSNAYLLSHKWAASTAPALCTVNATINCDKINSSIYSMLFGIPVTLFGIALYAGLALAALSPKRSSPRFGQVTTIFAILSLEFSAYLAAASFKVGAVCVMCLSIYTGNVLLLVAGLKGMREAGASLFADLGQALVGRSFVTVSAVFLVVTLVGRSAWMGRGGPEADAHSMAEAGGTRSRADIARLYAKPGGTVALNGAEPVLGNPKGRFQVIEFADFGCPHCAHAAPELKQLVEENPDVGVHFKTYPLSGACNPGLEGQQGAERCLGALAAECAHRQGKFWEMEGTMFANLGYLAQSDLEYMAGQVGVDVDQWKKCMQEPTAEQHVVNDATDGNKAHVQGTPTLFLQGAYEDQWVQITYTVSDLLMVIEAARQGPLPAPGPLPPEP